MYDIFEIRKDFPVLDNVIYLDSAATTQTPVQVVSAINDYFYKYSGSYGRGAHRLARESTNHYEDSREKVAGFLNVESSKTIMTKNATESINIVALGMGWNSGDHIVTTSLEHHSNLLPWMNLKDCGVDVTVVSPDDTGIVNPDDIYDSITERTRLVAVTHVSNIFGSVQDIKQITRISHKNGAMVLIDGAQSVGHFPVDVGSIGCDFFAASGHKGLLGPQGTGILYVKEPENLDPSYFGGGMVHSVTTSGFDIEPCPTKFESGTPNIPGVIGLGKGVEYVHDLGISNIEKHEKSLVKDMASKLSEMPYVEIYGPEDRSGVVPFNIAGLNSHDVAMILDETKGICVRSGHHCAMPALQALNVDGAVRASVGLYNTQEEIDTFIDAVSQITSLVG
ncbi:aminotransferase class V [Methanohalobium evestigatum Z-7303]|uniref:cysteine desulfurase n=1 Tax=Methanohalobium evestigatum (strain ATCC BAA-1072 / DSM 3721 / NBRC 107634 / OCM 161 / Z-7303) TaxID=644295 RepID=D7EBR3_METEZ|nr:cysteine desulfurase [Methanohalobium evestigatum]ADI74905.1 aminotransferase class V [Methanohalobium evestigatum Z-7303]